VRSGGAPKFVAGLAKVKRLSDTIVTANVGIGLRETAAASALTPNAARDRQRKRPPVQRRMRVISPTSSACRLTPIFSWQNFR
jgi:hypothetical protein